MSAQRENSSCPGRRLKTPLFLSEDKVRNGEGGLRTKNIFKYSLPGRPLVSVVTVVLDGERYVERTIQSVVHQAYDNIEYVIVDGGSRDGTLDILRQYEDAIDYWVSQSDNGIYDAFNIGLGLCTGDVVGIINSDDWYEEGAISRVVDAYNAQRFDYCFGNYRRIGGVSAGVSRPTMTSGFDASKLWGLPFGHPTCFVRRAVYELHGGFDTRYRLAADADLYFRFFREGLVGLYIDAILANYQVGGASSGYAVARETTQISIRHGANAFAAWIRYLVGFLRFVASKVYHGLRRKAGAMMRKLVRLLSVWPCV